MHDLFKSIVDDFTNQPAKVAAAQAKATMIAETYVCSMSDGLIEYGYTFKLDADAGDSEFDIRLGATRDEAQITAEFEKFEPTANLIAAALSQPPRDYRQALADLVALIERTHDNSEGAWPEPDMNCGVCTQGCAPTTGACAWHAAKRLVAAKP